MRPKNFPERKNRRRKKALENLKAYNRKNPSANLKRSIKDTESRIVDDARSVRTKILRGK
jgi:hypothetical protein